MLDEITATFQTPLKPSIDSTLSHGYTFLRKDFCSRLTFGAEISGRPDMSGARACPEELFSAMVILAFLREHAIDPKVRELLVASIYHHLRSGRLHFFKQRDILPADVDCTALGAAVLFEEGAIDRAQADAIATDIAANVGTDGIIRVYWPDAGRDHIDPVVCVNALYLLHVLDREGEAEASAALIERVLEDGSYLQGTRYYPSPDVFLGFLARLISRFPRADDRFGAALRRAVRERAGHQNSPLDLALHLYAAKEMELESKDAAAKLIEEQELDGSYAAAAFFRAGKRETYFGSQALTTAFALAALDDRGPAARHVEALSYYAD